MTVVKCWKGSSGKCCAIEESFLVRSTRNFLPVLIKEVFFTALFSFGEAKHVLLLGGVKISAHHL